jgi:hypothetical protein
MLTNKARSEAGVQLVVHPRALGSRSIEISIGDGAVSLNKHKRSWLLNVVICAILKAFFHGKYFKFCPDWARLLDHH